VLGFFNADSTASPIDATTIGYYAFVGGNLASWRSKK